MEKIKKINENLEKLSYDYKTVEGMAGPFVKEYERMIDKLVELVDKSIKMEWDKQDVLRVLQDKINNTDIENRVISNEWD